MNPIKRLLAKHLGIRSPSVEAISGVQDAFARGWKEGFENPRPLTAEEMMMLHRSARAATFWYDELKDEQP